MRRDELYLVDIVEACDAIARFVIGYDRGRLASDDLVGSAALQKLSIVGEAAARVSDALHADYPDVAWRQAAGIRNILVHSYFTVDWDVIWRTIDRDLPNLRNAVMDILQERWPETAAALQQQFRGRR